jgi:hypothetical protein
MREFWIDDGELKGIKKEEGMKKRIEERTGRNFATAS